MRQQRLAPATRALDVGPHRAVLRPARALGVPRGTDAARERAAIPLPDDQTGSPVRRRRLGHDQARAHQMPDDRPDAFPGRVATGPDLSGELADGDVVAPVEPRPPQPFGDALEHAGVEPRALDEEHVQALVALLGEQQAAGRGAVPPGSAGLLVIGLERARHGGVTDGPHVRLVDSHAEGVGRDEHRHLARHEPLLSRGPHLPGKPRVVGGHVLAQGAREQLSHLLTRAAGPGVHDRGQRIRLAQCRHKPPALVGRRRAADHGKRQIRPVEPGRDANRIAEREPARDVVGHRRRRGRGESHRRLRPHLPGGVGEEEVVGAEVVAPLGDAVRLVDDEQPDLDLPDELREARRGKALGGDVEQPDLARGSPGQRITVGAGALLRVDQLDPSRRDLAQRGHLVLHQRDERRDHEREVVAHQRRELVAERLARAGGHHHERVATRERGRDRLGLAGPEMFESEQPPERFAGIHGAPDCSGGPGCLSGGYALTSGSSSAYLPSASSVPSSG